MSRWRPGRWPLRTRVALAFLATTGLALTALGVFVQVRVGDALEDRLRDTVRLEAARLEAVPGARLPGAVQALSGEVHAQLLTTQGDVESSSSLLAGPMLRPTTTGAAASSESSWREATATVFDDDAAAEGQREQERERLVLLVRPTAGGVLVVGASREDVDEALAELRNQLLIAGPLALVVAGGLGYLVAAAGLRPIERMRARAATISSRSAGERLPVPAADDELRRLARTLNAMLGRLDDGMQRERRFVAEASHDLRTPLALMLTEVELALAQQRTPEELTAALRSIEDEVRRLIALAEALLERVGAEGIDVPVDARPVDLVALATRVAERFQPAAAGRDVTVVAPRRVGIRGDAVQLDRALSNLVDNALRHGTGDIEIHLGSTPVGAEMSVIDEGPGPSPGGSDGATDGDGLGLTIVEEIVRAHGGTVQVRHDGRRTRVRVELASPGSDPSTHHT